FLLAHLHLESLADTINPWTLWVTLEKLPKDIWDTYDKTLKRVDHYGDCQKELAYHIFGWIAFAVEPLNVTELQHALAIQPNTEKLDPINVTGEDILTSVCARLVIIDSKGSFLNTLLDYTIQEYFTHWQCKLFPNIHEEITCTCLTYMSFDIFNSLEGFNGWNFEKKYPFLKYSSRNWTYHARACGPGTVEQEILTFLLTQAEAFAQQYLDDVLYDSIDREEMPHTAAWFSAYYGLVHVMAILMDQPGVNLQNETVLYIAVYTGYPNMVDMLLSPPCNMDVNQVAPESAGPFYGWTPLIAAVFKGHEEIIKKLLESGGMKALNKLSNSPYWSRAVTALSVAVQHNNTGVVKLLLSQPNIDTSIRFNNTPLIDAMLFNHDEIVRVLLEWGKDDPNALVTWDDGRNALHVTVGCDYTGNILWILLNSDQMDVNKTDLKGQTALHIATYLNNLEFVEVLLKHKDIDIMIKDNDSKSIYDIAVEMGYNKIAALLAEHRGKALGLHE
ncbi:ankyrin repeat-containing domain protein, partial [Desarmillaria tabescens]